ncbi:MAG: DUF2817 domain-containing protein [Bdellovibrionales bacterium]|nr:DUF2817 domain-containing protein [Bdellovibrionales bacterium]
MSYFKTLARSFSYALAAFGVISASEADMTLKRALNPLQGGQISPTPIDVQKLCFESLRKISGTFDKERLHRACQFAKVLPGCQSTLGEPIFYFEKLASSSNSAKKILTMSLIHGDETSSGTVSRSWISRLVDLDSRNSWRVIPIVNPDGFKANTRTNANKVDVNRNFPTANWESQAIARWKRSKNSDPRRYPGPSPASEKETQCLLKHFSDFQPDFIISVHTPLGILDFDGPKHLSFPKFSPLPWISLGNYPGSLGRYMWKDRQVPVLTIELKGSEGISRLEEFDRLQDISGTVAIQSDRYLRSKNRRQKPKTKKVQSEARNQARPESVSGT